MTEQEFKDKCNFNYCPRGQKKAKNCKLNVKQERCYFKYTDKLSVYSEDKKKRKQLSKEINKRDKLTCLVVKCLTTKEIQLLIETSKTSLWKNARKDKAHILPKSKYPQFEYDIDNIFTCSRLYHERLDNYQDLITGEFIGENGRKKWIERIMKENNLWEDNFSYDDFLNLKQNQIKE